MNDEQNKQNICLNEIDTNDNSNKIYKPENITVEQQTKKQ